MNDDGTVQTTVEFDLPCGIEKDSQVHRHVTMRRMRNADFMRVSQDTRVKQFAKEDLSVSSPNPIQLMLTQDAMNQMFSILFTQVVLSIGDIQKPTKDVFDNMFTNDVRVMQQQFSELNEIDDAGEQALPFSLGGK